MKSWTLFVMILVAVACKNKPKDTIEVSGTVKNFKALAEAYPGLVRNNAVTL